MRRTVALERKSTFASKRAQISLVVSGRFVASLNVSDVNMASMIRSGFPPLVTPNRSVPGAPAVVVMRLSSPRVAEMRMSGDA
eukprot:1068378-Rhodomonas_salina.2